MLGSSLPLGDGLLVPDSAILLCVVSFDGLIEPWIIPKQNRYQMTQRILTGK